MIVPQSPQEETAHEQPRNRAAKMASLLLAVAATLAAVASFIEYFAEGDGLFLAVLIAVMALCAGMGFVAARAGKTIRSALLLIVPQLIGIPLFVTQTQGLGLLTGIFAVAFPTGIASLTLPPKYFRLVLLGAIASGLFAIIGDLYWPFEREALTLTISNFSVIVALLSLAAAVLLLARNFSNYSLSAKLIVVTTVVATLAVFAVAFGVNSFTRNALTIEAGKQLELLTESQGILIGELLFRELSTLQTLAVNESLLTAVATQNEAYSDGEEAALAEILQRDNAWQQAQEGDSVVTAVLQNQASEQLRQFRTRFPENTELLITDQYGALVAATNSTERYYQADEAWWQGAYNIGFGATYFSEPWINERNENGFVYIALPLFAAQADGTSAVVGVLQSTFSLKPLEDLMVAAQFGETGQIKLHFPSVELALNANERIELRRDHLIVASLLAEGQLADTDYILVDFDETPHLLSVGTINTLGHQPIVDELDWLISVQQAEEEALAAIDNQQRLNIWLGIFVILGTGAIAAYVGRQLTAPILRLTDVARRVTAGDLTAQASIETKDEIGTLAKTLNRMTEQVNESIANLEYRVQDRTRALETSIEVGRQISTVLDPQQLVGEVVTQVRDAFNYYHAHIYLVEENDEGEAILRMAGGTGDAGKEMLARGHKLTFGQGLVGQAATNQEPVLVPDVLQADGWLPNPLLPETKAEIAVPIARSGRVLGVLDVQHNVVNGLDQEDADLLVSVANQVAIAFENVRLLAQTQVALAETNEQVRRLELLNELSEAMSRLETVDGIIALLMQKAPEMIEASRISLHLISEENSTMLRVVGVSGLQDEDNIEEFPLAETPMTAALEQRQLASGTFTTGELKLSAYFAPLYASGRPLGTFNIAVPTEQDLKEGDRQILMQIASILGATIENRRLFDQTQARADKEQLVNSITRKIQNTMSVESALQTAVQELSEGLQAGYAEVQLKPTSKNGK